VTYGWWDMTVGGEIHTAPPGPNGQGNGRAGGNGAPQGIVEGEST
jgi:hypothetical protein